MALDNLIDIEFTEQELTDLDAHLDGIQAIIKDKVVQLTPKESKRYGKLGNERENWAKMILTDSKTAASLVPSFIDTKSWDKDVKAREQISPRASKLANISRQVTDTYRLLGFDIYQTCGSVYQNARYLSTQNAPGSKSYYDKWKVQFDKKDSDDGGDTPEQP